MAHATTILIQCPHNDENIIANIYIFICYNIIYHYQVIYLLG